MISEATRYVDGGRVRLLDYCKIAVADGNPLAVLWWNAFSEIDPGDQGYVSYDDVCAACGITPSSFLGMIVEAGAQHEMETADLIAISLQPKLVRQMAKSALRISGKHAEVARRDRESLLQQRKFLAAPRGLNVNVNATASANAKAAAASISEPSVPSFVGDMDDLVAPKADVQRALSAVLDAEMAD